MLRPNLSATLLPLVLLCAACGGSKEPAASPESQIESASEVEGPTAPDSVAGESGGDESRAVDGKLKIPSTCHDTGATCTPSPKWVKALCQDVYPAVALYLFQSSMPFTHAYLSRKTKAVNASGGATSGTEWLEFDEEVVLLHSRSANSGGIQVSGAEGGFDAIRLDGSCVTLDASEVRMQAPPSPKYTGIPWRYLGDDMEDALLKVPAVKKAYIARRKECRGAFSGSVSSKCVQLDNALNKTIVSALKNGETDLPEPSLRP